MALNRDRYPYGRPLPPEPRLHQTAKRRRPSGDGGRTRRRLRRHIPMIVEATGLQWRCADAAGQQNLGRTPSGPV